MSLDASTTELSPPDDPPAGALDKIGIEVETTAKPRLSILHLMVWTATSAAMMALIRVPPEKAATAPVALIMLAALAMYCGAAIGGVLMWAARKRRGTAFPTEPGEWLLLIQGECVIYFVLLYYLLQIIPSKSLVYIEWLFALLFALGFAAIGVVPAILFAGENDETWKLFLVLLAVLFCFIPLTAIFPPLLVFFGIVLVAAIFTFAIAFAADIRRRPKRGWVHWTGAVSMIFFGCFALFCIVATLLAIYARV